MAVSISLPSKLQLQEYITVIVPDKESLTYLKESQIHK